MGMFDWFKKNNDKVDESVEDDDDMDELLEELGFDSKPDLRSQMMYAFIHLTIRDAVMFNHPELTKQLDKVSKEKPFMPLLHFWSKATMIVESDNMFDEEDEDEWMPFDEMHIEQLNTSGNRITIVTFPQPSVSPEAYMAAIVHKQGEPLPYDGKRGTARYFTLEYTQHDTPPVLCECDGEEHINFGEGPAPDTKAFIHAVQERL